MGMTISYSLNKKRKRKKPKKMNLTITNRLLWSSKRRKSIRREIRFLNRSLAR
jgi:hypothetical protein